MFSSSSGTFNQSFSLRWGGCIYLYWFDSRLIRRSNGEWGTLAECSAVCKDVPTGGRLLHIAVSGSHSFRLTERRT